MPETTVAAAHITASAEKLIAWLESQHYRGIDPYDGLNSRVLGALARRSRHLGIVFTQIIRRSPINLRPLLGITADHNPKGMGLFLAAFVRRYSALGQPDDLERAQLFARWLADNKCQGYQGACWGYNFDWANRGFYAPQGTPTIVNTAFIGQALCDFGVVFNEPWAIELARSACDFILRDLNRLENERGICFSYTPRDTQYIHNANMLGAALLARVGTLIENQELLRTARRAVAFTVAAQAPNGSWAYGLAAHARWSDNFHTGFVLGTLVDLIDRLDATEWEDALARGYTFWRTQFFLADGTPKYTPASVYPIDAHSVAEAVLASLGMQSRDSQAYAFAARQLEWGIEHMQDAKGYFYYQIQRHYTNRIPYIRWSNAWMLRAEAEYLWGNEFDKALALAISPVHSK